MSGRKIKADKKINMKNSLRRFYVTGFTIKGEIGSFFKLPYPMRENDAKKLLSERLRSQGNDKEKISAAMEKIIFMQ